MKENKLEDQSIVLCPYCSNILKQFPKSKKKCEYCKNLIYVRTSPDTGFKIIVTEKESNKLDAELKKKYFRNKWLRNIEGLGISKEDFQNKHEEFYKKNGTYVKDGDVFWSLFNELIIKTSDTKLLRGIYYEMAWFLFEEGRDYFAIRQQSARMQLLSALNSNLNLKATILTCGDGSCQECNKLANTVYTIEEALEKMPIPCPDCTHLGTEEKKGFCRCWYGITVQKN
ncbi:MAG TPA: hypothetical protein VN192_00135 [Flavobacterium sp.]|nr:hypothetical protein [Flavobacterium sp.]